MSLPKCVWQYILNKANWFPARAVNRAFRALVDVTYIFKKKEIARICKKSTPNVLKLLEKQFDIYYDGLFHFAAANSNEMAKYFLQKGTEYFNKGWFVACRSNNRELIDILINKGVNLWNDGLEAANQTGNLELAKFMIKKGADCNFLNLSHVCASGNMELINLIIETGADNWYAGATSACLNGHLEVLKLMLSKVCKKNYETLLIAAAVRKHLNIVKYLLKTTMSRNTYKLCMACATGDFDKVILYQQELFDARLETMSLAALNGHLKIIEYLVSRVQQDVNNALCYACRGGHIDVAKFLISKGANIWNKALRDACLSGNIELIDLIFKKGATNEVKCFKIAHNEKKLNVLKYFIVNGIDPENIFDHVFALLNEEIAQLLINTCLKNKCLFPKLAQLVFTFGTLDQIKCYSELTIVDWEEFLDFACTRADMELVQFAIFKGAHNWNKALFGACSGRNIRIVKLILEKGANEMDNVLALCKLDRQHKIIKILKKNKFYQSNKCK